MKIEAALLALASMALGGQVKHRVAKEATSLSFCTTGATCFATPVHSSEGLSERTADQGIIVSSNAPAAIGPYSQAIKTPNLIFLSGQLPVTAAGALVKGTIADKTRQSCQNIQAILEAAGSSMSRVVKVTVFLSSISYFDDMNKEYEKWFSHKPARSTIAVKNLPKYADVEIEVIALP